MASHWLRHDVEDPPSTFVEHADVVIVGAGMTGVFAAHSLRERGYKGTVLLLDGRGVARGASGRNGGHLWPSTSFLEQDCARRVLALIQRLGIDCELNVAGSVALEERAGAPWDRSRLEKEIPQLSSQFQSGTLEPHGATLNPHLLLQALLRNTPDILFARTEVRAVRSTAAGAEVEHTKGVVRCHKVLIATNAWAPRLLPRLPITPVRGQCAHFETGVPLKRCVAVGEGKTEYIVPTASGMVFGGLRRFGSDAEVGVADDSTISSSISQAFPRMYREFFTDKASVVREWTGIMGFSSDGQPFVGECAPHIFCAAGFTGHGMPTCPVAADAVAALMLGKPEGAQIPPAWNVARLAKKQSKL